MSYYEKSLHKNNLTSYSMSARILNKLGIYDVELHTQDTADETTDIYMLSLYNGDSLLLRCTYILLGKYSILKNMWCWADSSSHISKDITLQTKKLRSALKNNKMLNFVKKNTSYLALDELFAYLETIATIQSNHVILNASSKFVDVFLINKLLFNSSKLL